MLHMLVMSRRLFHFHVSVVFQMEMWRFILEKNKLNTINLCYSFHHYWWIICQMTTDIDSLVKQFEFWFRNNSRQVLKCFHPLVVSFNMDSCSGYWPSFVLIFQGQSFFSFHWWWSDQGGTFFQKIFFQILESPVSNYYFSSSNVVQKSRVQHTLFVWSCTFKNRATVHTGSIWMAGKQAFDSSVRFIIGVHVWLCFEISEKKEVL